MKSTIKETESGCGCTGDSCGTESGLISISDSIMAAPPVFTEDEPCCGPPAGPPADPSEMAGYKIMPYVETFVQTAAGNVPKIRTKLDFKDHFFTAVTRLNIGRNDYKVSPGLYCVGTPDDSSPVLVTANYKLTFDTLRKELEGLHAWILVLDTRGINVWCAAGKGTFGTWELANRIRLSGLEKVVSHKTLIVPQLGAVGVSAIEIKKATGFKVTWGPVHTKDLVDFINNDMTATPEMRRVTFTLPERLVLVPVEISLVLKPAAIIFLALLVLSGFGPGFYSISAAWERGFAAIITIISGIIAGTVVTPALLNKIPGVSFSVKGVVSGLALSLPAALISGYSTGFSGVTALVLYATSVSSYTAMNFTGTTPFTSPSGVEKEMKIAIPIQIAAVVIGLILWIISAF